MRRNHWVTDKTAMASWTATLPAASPELVRAILRVGGETGVFLVPAAERSASSLRNVQPSGRVAFFDASGEVREKIVSDLGGLLRRLEPRTGLDRHHSAKPPVVIDAYLPEEIRISLFSDIWFPQVAGFAELGFWERIDEGRLYDNSPLAARHTPRLNQFLEEVRQAALSAGAVWELDPEPEPLYQLYFEICTERGIRQCS